MFTKGVGRACYIDESFLGWICRQLQEQLLLNAAATMVLNRLELVAAF